MADLMSQPGAGSAVALSNKIQDMQRAYAPPDNLQAKITQPDRQNGGEFAARYFQRTKEEEAIDLKKKFIKQAADEMADGEIQVQYTPGQDELDVIKRKQAQGVQYAFHHFVKSMVRPDKSFVNAKYFADNFPDILQKELEEVDTKFEQLKRLAKILIRNQINQEDAAYLFSIASMNKDDKKAYIEWLKHPVFMPWDKTTQEKVHQLGKLNPKRFLGRVAGARTPESLQRFDIGNGQYGDVPTALLQGQKGYSLFPQGGRAYEASNVDGMLQNFFS